MQMETKRFDGIEVGTVSIKYCRLHENGKVEYSVLRHEGTPREKLELLLLKKYSKSTGCIITGHSTKLYIESRYCPESECIERAVSEYKQHPDIVLSLGGESFVVYTLKKRRSKKHTVFLKMRGWNRRIHNSAV